MIKISPQMLDSKVRHDFVCLFDVVNGNPNGDPDAGNMPRVDPETMHGLVTDVSIKRKIRNYAVLNGQKIFIQDERALNTLIEDSFKEVGIDPVKVDVKPEILSLFPEELLGDFSIDDKSLIYAGPSGNKKDIVKLLNSNFEEENLDKELSKELDLIASEIAKVIKDRKATINKEDRAEARDIMIRDYYDVRMFGAVMSTGLNAGQVRGPMQLTFGHSLDPIHPLDLSITRQARTTVERMETGSTEMGRKPIVPYGLYRFHGFYSPAFAEQVNEADLQLFWEALIYMWEHDRSASRGQMACRGLYVFSHDNALGKAPSHRLFKRIKVNRKENIKAPRSFDDDYIVSIDEEALPEGVKLTRAWHE